MKKNKLIKGNITVSLEEQELALSLCQEIAFDNGFFDRWNPEQYNAKWINKIGLLAKKFFDSNPELLTDENINDICSGEESEIIQKYGTLSGFKKLHESLNDYFNNH